MDKKITLSYDSGKAIVDVPLTYTAELLGNVHTITCHVGGPPFPLWLQTRKFELMSLDKNALREYPLATRGFLDYDLESSKHLQPVYKKEMFKSETHLA